MYLWGSIRMAMGGGEEASHGGFFLGPEFGLVWQSLFCGGLKDALRSLIWLVV